jgi:conjugal transfer pilin signal peptidase TrbI
VLEDGTMSVAPPRTFRLPRPWLSLAIGLASAAALYLGYGRSFVSLAWDPHEVNCLPELHLALLVHHRPARVERGDYVFWKASAVTALSYVKEDFVLKRVAGVPGDVLRIRGDQVSINGRLVAEGLEDAVLYRRRPADFQREEVIPPGRYFVIGTARMSNDSRYWGYLPHEAIVGTGYRIY